MRCGEVRDPLREVLERIQAHGVETTLSVRAHVDESRLAQQLEMPRHCRLSQPERGHDVPHRALLVAEHVEDGASRRVAERSKNRGEHGASIASEVYMTVAMYRMQSEPWLWVFVRCGRAAHDRDADRRLGSSTRTPVGSIVSPMSPAG